LAGSVVVLAAACTRAADDSPRQADTRAPDSTRPEPGGTVAVVVHRVNNGTSGMASRLRWIHSPDRRAILVMEDPTAVEAEPVANGVLYASEEGPTTLQRDTVWDAAPSPDWRWLAYGRAHLLRVAERDSATPAEWRAFAARAVPATLRGPTDSATIAAVRAHAFPASGMAIAWGLGVAYVVPLNRAGADRPLRLDGWRVRWTRGPDTIAVGAAPTVVQDYSPPSRWRLVRVTDGALLATIMDSSRLPPVAWVEGPTLDISVAIDRNAPAIIIGDRRLETVDGLIHLVTPAGRQPLAEGVALAATATGRFVVAVVPRPAPRRSEGPMMPVVLELRAPPR
jgi:hypothetical protein